MTVREVIAILETMNPEDRCVVYSANLEDYMDLNDIYRWGSEGPTSTVELRYNPYNR